LLGNGAWWLPKWLDRVLPNVDVEGAHLTEKLDNDSDNDSDGGERVLQPA
jgi:RND superfamily putative drug exporter